MQKIKCNGLMQFNKNFQILFKFLKYINVNEEINLIENKMIVLLYHSFIFAI